MSLLFCGAWLALSAWVPPALAEPLTPDSVVRSALEHDPSYLSAVAAVHAARGDLRAATFLRENPTVSGELSLTSDRAGASIDQAVSLTGEGFAAHRAAALRMDAAELDARRAALVVAAEARLAWTLAVAAELHAGIASQALEQASTRRAAVEARVAAGDAPALDASLVRLEEGRAAAALVSARAEVVATRVTLARFVPEAGSANLPDDPLLAAPDPIRGEGSRTDVAAAVLRADAAVADRRATRAASLPAITVGVFVEQDDGVLNAGPTVGVTLPLWHRNPAGIGSADAALTTATAEAAAMRAVASAERSGTEQARKVADDVLARVTVPAGVDAREALLAIDASQAVGELDAITATLLRADVLDAWSASVDLRRAVAEARIDALLASEDAALLPPELREEIRP